MTNPTSDPVAGFLQAERRFRELTDQFTAGRLSPEAYQAEVGRLRLVDEAGRTWALQERSGRWFVWDGGRWQAAEPPGLAHPPVLASPPPDPPRPTRRRTRLWVAGALVVLLAICAAALAGGWFALRNGLLADVTGLAFLDASAGTTSDVVPDQPDPAGAPAEAPGGTADDQAPTAKPDPTDPPPAPPGLGLNLLAALPVPADGAPVADEQGTSLQVPAGALGDGQGAQIEAHEAAGELVRALEDAYVIETPFYAVSAAGADDATGRATLTLPAADAGSRILAVFDDQFPVLLDVAPQAGTLQLYPRLGPAETGDQPQVGSLAPGGSVHYAVIHPRETTSGRRTVPGQAALAQDAGRSCLPKLDALGGVSAFCVKNVAGTVYAYYPPGFDTAAVDPYQVTDQVAEIMAAYARLGFTAAALTPSTPVYVRLASGAGDPSYLVSTGTIHLPAASAATLGAGWNHDLLHELAHWIQDEEYVMSWAYWRGNQTWWLEIAAENMVMLVDSAYVDQNLIEYGTISLADNTLAFQNAPYQWPGESYIQAQLLKLNLCDDPIVCPLSQATFVGAINEGSYPLDDESARAKLSNNLDAFARYLLGVAPGRANSAIPLTGAVNSGRGYGESVAIWEGVQQGPWTVTLTGVDPQMKRVSEREMDAVSIDAPLQKDGVYPLIVSSGVEGGANPGLPAKLTVAPGAPYWVRIGAAEPVFYDGTKEVVLQPIHASMGLPSVRIVALGRDGGERFQARIEYIDLSGAWLVLPGNVIRDDVVCTTTGPEASMSDGARLASGLITYGNLFGDYGADAGDNSLTWALVGSRLGTEIDPDDFTFDGAVIVGPADIQLQARMEIPNQQSRRPGGPVSPAVAFLGGVLPLGLVLGARARGSARGRGLRRSHLALLVLALVTLVGCDVFINFYGHSTGELAFTKLEYVGGEEPLRLNFEDVAPTEPLWRLSGGTGTYQLDFTFVAGSTDEDGNVTESVSQCTGPAVFEVTAAIYTDAVIQFSTE